MKIYNASKMMNDFKAIETYIHLQLFRDSCLNISILSGCSEIGYHTRL